MCVCVCVCTEERMDWDGERGRERVRLGGLTDDLRSLASGSCSLWRMSRNMALDAVYACVCVRVCACVCVCVCAREEKKRSATRRLFPPFLEPAPSAIDKTI